LEPTEGAEGIPGGGGGKNPKEGITGMPGGGGTVIVADN